MRGRKPKPTAMRVLGGNAGKRPVNRHEPKPAAVLPSPPDWIDAEARAEWERMAPVLFRLGVLTEADLAVFTSYCQCWAQWRDAEEKVKQFGAVLKTKSGFPVVSPYVAIANKRLALMLKAQTELGMTPSSRARLHVAEAPEVDEFAQFEVINGGKA